MKQPRRAFIIGLDAITPELLKRFAAAGRMPNLSKLIERGVFTRTLPVLPTHTPVNWTTISTGAWPGTHGITGFSVKERYAAIANRKMAFDSRLVQAEYLWNTAAKVGKKSILLKWGSPMLPFCVDDGIQVDGCFCVACEHEIISPRMYSSMGGPESVPLHTSPAQGWRNLPQSRLAPLETELCIGPTDGCIRLHLLWIAADADFYDTALVCRDKDVSSPLSRIGVREWTAWQRLTFPKRGGGVVDGTFRVKLIALPTAETGPELFCSQVMPVTGWTDPPDIAEELTDAVGPFLHQPGYKQGPAIYGGFADYETMREEMDYQHDWYAAAAIHLCENYDFDLFFLQCHSPDSAQDSRIREAEPLTADRPEQSTEVLEYIGDIYESCDRMVGKIVDEVVTADDLVVVVSDHGCIGYFSEKSIGAIVKELLTENGYLAFKGEQARDPGSKPRQGDEEVDWSTSMAVFHDSIYIYMNVKGREVAGVIEPEEYEKVRTEIIELLRSYRDPRLGRCPFQLVLRIEDAAPLGLHGPRVGDIVVCAEPGGDYGEGHGTLLPTARFGMSSLNAVLLMAGPGVRKGVEIDRPSWVTDIAPTVAHLMGIPSASTMEGAVVNAALDKGRG